MTSEIRSLHQKVRVRSACGPVIETLEQRSLLSVTLANGLLSITGTNADDKISLRSAPNNEIRVVVNKEISFFAKEGLTGIFVDALGGDDRVELQSGGVDVAPNVPATILGGAGDDTLGGAGGDDNIRGGAGDDLILGNKGNDTLIGEDGDDRLVGGAGDDVLRGLLGDDALVTGDGAGSAIGGPGKDHVEKGSRPQFPIETFTGVPTGYTPTQQRQAYGLGSLNDPTYTNRGKGQTIVIVDAFHAPNIRKDLITFAREMRTLPGVSNLNKYFKTHFHQVFASGRRPTFDEDWNGEATLDVQWAHAIAPEAKIILVELDSNAFGDIMQGMDKSISVLNKSKWGGGPVSISIGTDFQTAEQEVLNEVFGSARAEGASFIVAAGDTGGVPSFPATSPHVTAIGGTTLYLDPFGNRIPGDPNAPTVDATTGLDSYLAGDIDCTDLFIPGGERPWWQSGSPYPVGPGGGGGPSDFFDMPGYQQNRILGFGIDVDGNGVPNRATPDVSLNADPRTGVTIYNSAGSAGGAGWATIGGTSAGAPQFAGMVALANQLRVLKNKDIIGGDLQERIYRIGQRGADTATYDIGQPALHGTGVLQLPDPCDNVRNPPGWQWFSDPGWDYATGFGSPGRGLIPALAEQKPVLTARNVVVNGTFMQLDLTTATPAFRSIQFKGNTSVQGLYTLNMPATTLRQTFPLPTTTSGGNTGGGGGGGGGQQTVITRIIDLFGMDAQTGVALPPTIDAVTGQITTPGTNIVLTRSGNAVTGVAFVRFAETATGGPGPGVTNVVSGAVRFNGKIVKGKVNLTFQTVNPDGTFVNKRQAFELGLPIITGKISG